MPHMQHGSPDGKYIASLDPRTPALVLSDAEGHAVRRISLGPMRGIAGFRWLRSSTGLAVWSLDTVVVLRADGTDGRELAYEIDQPEGKPLAIEDVRAIPDGLLVVAQACALRAVDLTATVVHLEGTRVTGQTNLRRWSGTLYAATALDDGKIVLALNETQHGQSAFLQCVADRVSQYGAGAEARRSTVRSCWHAVRRSRFGASEFRILRVHEHGLVEVVGRHRCPSSRGCFPTNWAPNADELVWANRVAAFRLRSAIAVDPLLPASGAWTGLGRASGGSLWVEGERVLSSSSQDVRLTDFQGNAVLGVRHDEHVRSTRFRPDASGAVVVLGTTIIDLDFASGEETQLFELLDVPAAFDARYENLAFNDAALHESGALTFDVVAEHRGRRFAHKSVVAGSGHPGCSVEHWTLPGRQHGLFDLVADPVASYRSVGHLTRPRVLVWR